MCQPMIAIPLGGIIAVAELYVMMIVRVLVVGHRTLTVIIAVEIASMIMNGVKPIASGMREEVSGNFGGIATPVDVVNIVLRQNFVICVVLFTTIVTA